jgi:hypothetical protein
VQGQGACGRSGGRIFDDTQARVEHARLVKVIALRYLATPFSGRLDIEDKLV